jgi:cbb3-type cytochrome oxidase subunit 1
MSVRLIKLAVVYLVIGMTLGVGMGMTHNFLFRSVHAHVNLLGWASLALAALVFHVFPETARTRLAIAWFWTYNLSLPIGMAAIALVLTGHKWAEPALIVSQLGIWSAGLMFAINVFWSLCTKRAEPSAMAPSPAAAR